MNILNLFKVSLRAISSNKMRSFLSMLGIIIGVAAVIIMMAIGQGSKESIRKELSTMGTNLLTIRPGADMRGGVRQDPSAMQTLKPTDYETILAEKKYITKVSPEVNSATTPQPRPPMAKHPTTSTSASGKSRTANASARKT